MCKLIYMYTKFIRMYILYTQTYIHKHIYTNTVEEIRLRGAADHTATRMTSRVSTPPVPSRMAGIAR